MAHHKKKWFNGEVISETIVYFEGAATVFYRSDDSDEMCRGIPLTLYLCKMKSSKFNPDSSP